jgi:hypothetical protein
MSDPRQNAVRLGDATIGFMAAIDTFTGEELGEAVILLGVANGEVRRDVLIGMIDQLTDAITTLRFASLCAKGKLKAVGYTKSEGVSWAEVLA